MHYHFDTKRRLLVAAADRLASQRAERRLAALSRGVALSALDDLWDGLREGAANGTERAYVDLALHASTDAAIGAVLTAHRIAERAAIAARLPALLRELGAAPAFGIEELVATLAALLDGFALALLAGRDEAPVRAAYDAFWLTLISAGPREGR